MPLPGFSVCLWRDNNIREASYGRTCRRASSGKRISQFRVRIHGTIARIELLPEDISRMLDEKLRKEIVDKLKRYGFTYVSLDLEGYRTGSMNEVLA